jgi:hypothetical protein
MEKSKWYIYIYILNYFELDASFGEGGERYLLQVGQVGLET